jgi:hypothetical protein
MRRWALALLATTGVAAAAVAVLIITNPAPEVPSTEAVSAEAAPYVIKLHARWCPICMVTRGAWATVQDAYAGRVRFVVFDFTSDATTETSRAEAVRLGLEDVFDDYVGETGTVLVLDGASREVLHSLHGHHDEAEYRAAIDAVLER